jgi:rhodanese-related sulfurtransferase
MLHHLHPSRWKITGKLIVLFVTILIVILFMSERMSFALRDTSARPLAVSFINAAELMSWIEHGRAFQLVDARPDSVYAKGHIIEAMSIRRLSVYDAVGREPVVIYCDRSPVSKLDPCFRAVVAAMQDGLREVYWFKGGVSAWRSEGFALEGSEASGRS